MKTKTLITITDTDKDGNPIGVSEEFEANSFVNNFINIIFSQFEGGISVVTASDTAGSSTSRIMGYVMSVGASPANTDTYGIQVGIGSNAVAIADFKLQTKISQSITGESGKMVYSGHTAGAPATVGGTISFTIARTFINNSGSTITINEIGIVTNLSGTFFLLDRTLHTKAVLTGTGTTITYTISVTV